MFFKCLLFGFCTLPTLAFSQEQDIQDLITPIIANLVDAEDLESLNQLNEDILQLVNDPIPLNSAGPDELASIPLIPIFTAHAIFQYRRRSGRIFDLMELIDIEGVNLAMIQYLKYVTTLDMAPKDTKMTHSLALGGAYELERKKGYDGDFTGPPGSQFFRYRTRKGPLKAGLSMQRDAGEPGWVKGPDHISGFLCFTGGNWKGLVGDYHANMGQGATIWTGFNLRSPTNPNPFSRSSRNISPYSGNNEGFYLRGGTISWVKDRTFMTLFLSHRKLDASVNGVGDTAFFRSLTTSGLHRTPSEISKANSVTHSLIGANIEQRWGPIKVGGVVVGSGFSPSWRKTSYPSGEPGFPIKRQIGWSVFGDVSYNRSFGFWEMAFDKGAPALITGGWTFIPSDEVRVGFHGRKVFRQRQSLLAQPLNNGNGAPEIGSGISIDLKASNKIDLRVVSEIYRIKGPVYGSMLPRSGGRHFFLIRYHSGQKTQCEARYILTAREDQERTDGNPPTKDHQYRIAVRKRLNETWSMDSRIHGRNRFYSSTGGGRLWMMEVKYDRSPWKFWFRYSFFHTDGYDQRLYVFETNVPYSFSSPPFYGSGQRFYLVLGREWGAFNYWLKMGHTRYMDDLSRGTGVDMIIAPTRTRIDLVITMKI